MSPEDKELNGLKPLAIPTTSWLANPNCPCFDEMDDPNYEPVGDEQELICMCDEKDKIEMTFPAMQDKFLANLVECSDNVQEKYRKD